MSVTIVSTLPKPAQATAADNTTSTGSDTAAAGLDFASLLFGQLMPVATITTENNLETTSSETDATPVDTSNLFAALGIVPTEVKPVSSVTSASTSDLPAIGKIAESASDKLSGLQTPAPQASQIENSGNTVMAPEIAARPEIHDTPAKFAAAIPKLSIVENILPKTTTADAPANTNIAVLMPSNSSMSAISIPHDAPTSIPTPVRDPEDGVHFSPLHQQPLGINA